MGIPTLERAVDKTEVFHRDLKVSHAAPPPGSRGLRRSKHEMHRRSSRVMECSSPAAHGNHPGPGPRPYEPLGERFNPP